MSHDNHNESHKHYILEPKVCFSVGLGLLFLTFITVWIAQFDFGPLNFTIAMLVATVKAMLVILYFMGLKYDSIDNRVIFGSSIIFGIIFIVLTSADLLFRGENVYVEDGKIFKDIQGAELKFNRFWIASDELMDHGKALYSTQCASCHGDAGKGDGPAAASLNPAPRNFTVASGWINGRKPSQVYKTLTEGVNSMPAFGSLPVDDRWALAHYILAFGPQAPKDSAADLKAAGIDTSKEDGGLGSGGGEKTLPIDFAIERMSEDS